MEKGQERFETFAVGDEEDLGDDWDTARVLFGHCRLGYIIIAALMNELSQTFGDRSEMSSTRRQNGRADENRFRHHMQLPPCQWMYFEVTTNPGHLSGTCSQRYMWMVPIFHLSSNYFICGSLREVRLWKLSKSHLWQPMVFRRPGTILEIGSRTRE